MLLAEQESLLAARCIQFPIVQHLAIPFWAPARTNHVTIQASKISIV